MDEKDIRACLFDTAKELGIRIQSLSRNPLTQVWHIVLANKHEQVRFKPLPDATAADCALQFKQLLGFGEPVLEEEIDELRGFGSSPDSIFTAMQRLKQIGEAAVEPLINAFLNVQESPIFRSRVAGTLAMIASPKAIEPLIQALSDLNVEVRWHAVKALADIGDERAMPTLEKIAATDTGGFSITPTLYARVSEAAQEAINKIKSRQGRNP